MTLYDMTTFSIVVMELFLTLTLLRVIKKSSPELSLKTALIFSTWLVSVMLLFGVYPILPTDISSGFLFAIILFGVALSGIVFYYLRDAFLALPQELLLLPQAFRMFFGAIFLIEAAFEIMPLSYGVIDGVLHITTAYLSLTLAVFIARGCSCKRSLILVNLFGLLDIVVVAAGIAFMILPEIGVEHNVFLAVFYAAPIFIYLHLISLYKLFKERN